MQRRNPPASDPILLQKIAALDAKVTNLQSDVTSIKGNVSAIQSDLANVPIIETLSGHYQLVGGSAYPIESNYPSIRHVSLTIFVAGLVDDNDSVAIMANIGGPAGYQVFSKSWVGLQPYVETVNLQFDADYWYIFAEEEDVSSPNVTVNYAATVTYPGS